MKTYRKFIKTCKKIIEQRGLCSGIKCNECPFKKAVCNIDREELKKMAEICLAENKVAEVKFKGRCEHGNMHYECKYCKEEN